MNTRGHSSKIDADRLRMLARSGASVTQIMAVFRVSKVAVYRACHRNEIPLPRTEDYRKAGRQAGASAPPATNDPPPAVAPRLSALIATGGRYAGLAEWASNHGVTMARAQQEWHRLGLPLRKAEKPEERLGNK
jgi:hypothetical protein